MSKPDLNVRDISTLARLNLTEEEVSTFQSQLSQVLEYVEQLDQVDVSNVEPTAHTNPVFNVLRQDGDREWFNAQDALANAPHAANGLFTVTKVIE